MDYQQRSPYQTTVIEQPLVVVPLVSGPSAVIRRHAPAHIKNGTKVCGHLVGLRCICCISVFGVIMFTMGAVTMMIPYSNTEPSQDGHKQLSPIAIYGLIQLLIGAPFLFLSAYLCGISKRDYDRQRSHESNAPYSQPFIEGRNSSGLSNSQQRQSSIIQPIAATAPSVQNYEPLLSPPTAPPAYEPVLTVVPPSTQLTQQSTDGMAMIQAIEGIPNNGSPVSYSVEMGSEQQTSQPQIDEVLIDTFSAVVPDSRAPYTGLEMALAQVYEEHPANAPPEYSP